MGVESFFSKDSVIVLSLLKSRAFFFLWFVFFLYPIICGLVRERRFVLFFFKILSFGRIIAKMTLSDSLLFEIFRNFFN
jgi:hypothetical protein